MKAQGWYRDPYGIHQDRYFSAGSPTKLVRDDGQESYDPPPDEPLPGKGLTPVEPAGSEAADGADMLRADQPVPIPLKEQIRRAKNDLFDQLPKP